MELVGYNTFTRKDLPMRKLGIQVGILTFMLTGSAPAIATDNGDCCRRAFCEGISVEIIPQLSGTDAAPATVEDAIRNCLSQCNEPYDDTPEFACVRQISTTLRPGNIAADQPDIIEVTGRCLRARRCPEQGPGLPPPRP